MRINTIMLPMMLAPLPASCVSSAAESTSSSSSRTSHILSTTPANPLPYHEVQPDGSSTPLLHFEGHGLGEPFVSDEEGYVVMRDEEGWVVYAEDQDVDDRSQSDLQLRRRLDESDAAAKVNIKPSRHVVGSVDPSTLQGLTTAAKRRRFKSNKSTLDHTNVRRRLQSSTATTKFQSLILLIRFADHTSRELPSQSNFHRFFNKLETSDNIDDVAPTGSIKQVFLQNSYGKLEASALVVDWITVSGTEEYYANGEYGFGRFQEAILEALDRVFEGTDLDGLDRIDGLGVMHSGYGAEYGGLDCYNTTNGNRIWSHQAGNLGFINPYASSSGTEANGTDTGVLALQVPDQYYVASALRAKCGADIARIGIVVHEYGHQLGLPDLYDKTFEGNGVGSYDPMSRSWGWDGSGMYPPIFSAWSKMTLGWVDPIEIKGNGVYSLGFSASAPQVYIIQEGYPEGEYLLIENRQAIGFDAQLKGGGIAVWHINENANGEAGYLGQEGWPANGNYYKVSLLQADGNQDLEQGVNHGDEDDLWHVNSTFTVLGPSSPGALLPHGNVYIVPNTDSQQGNVAHSGIWLYDFSESGDFMTFSVKGLHGVVSPSFLTARPTSLVSYLFRFCFSIFACVSFSNFVLVTDY